MRQLTKTEVATVAGGAPAMPQLGDLANAFKKLLDGNPGFNVGVDTAGGSITLGKLTLKVPPALLALLAKKG